MNLIPKISPSFLNILKEMSDEERENFFDEIDIVKVKSLFRSISKMDGESDVFSEESLLKSLKIFFEDDNLVVKQRKDYSNLGCYRIVVQLNDKIYIVEHIERDLSWHMCPVYDYKLVETISPFNEMKNSESIIEISNDLKKFLYTPYKGLSDLELRNVKCPSKDELKEQAVVIVFEELDNVKNKVGNFRLNNPGKPVIKIIGTDEQVKKVEKIKDMFLLFTDKEGGVYFSWVWNKLGDSTKLFHDKASMTTLYGPTTFGIIPARNLNEDIRAVYRLPNYDSELGKAYVCIFGYGNIGISWCCLKINLEQKMVYQVCSGNSCYDFDPRVFDHRIESGNLEILLEVKKERYSSFEFDESDEVADKIWASKEYNNMALSMTEDMYQTLIQDEYLPSEFKRYLYRFKKTNCLFNTESEASDYVKNLPTIGSWEVLNLESNFEDQDYGKSFTP